MEGIRRSSRKNIYHFGFWRITVLTTRLFRLEYSPRQQFEDRFSQIVVHRDFEETACTFSLKGDTVQIITADSMLWVNGDCFDFSAQSPSGGAVWRRGDPLHNLGGTARTLDNADGPVPLEDGIFSREGIGVLMDHSCLQDPTGEYCPRSSDHQDVYLFLYGKQFTEGLQAFYQLTGRTPLLPRFALGNWWSRFWPYTQQEYLELMDRFEQEGIPFSVAVLDMDWHLTRVPEGYSGWTGYTWNRELFPNPKDFLYQLHRRGKHVTLNLHPADGVQPFEERYSEMAKAMGISLETAATIPFDFVDPTFRAGYFDVLLRPLEQTGVDFWWIDWQQGTQSKIAGLDPLWLLNHYQFRDLVRQGRSPLILSRYAGPGSHRYPVGFSGDTVVSWSSLAFQPYFTATAANIGYGWWSHDIGGHMNGIRDDELACRWVQFGVFSPINRLHSTCNRFAGKEPWRYRQDVREIMVQFLRLRHRLLPYLYSMNYRCHLDGIPLIRPMYHGWPESQEAYHCHHQYEFGSQMIVAPAVTPQDPASCVSATDVWLPDGTYYDFFTGIRYRGGRWLRAYRPLSSIPVFVKAGGIIPMGDVRGPDEPLECVYLRVYPGNDGQFSLCEDDGHGPETYVKTDIQLFWEKKSITIHPTGNLTVLPESRRFVLCLCGITVETVSVTIGSDVYSMECTYDEGLNGSVVLLPVTARGKNICIDFHGWTSNEKNTQRKELFRLLQRSQVGIDLKEAVFRNLEQTDFTELPEMAYRLPSTLREAMAELLDISADPITPVLQSI